MRAREGQRWREYQVPAAITVGVFLSVEPSRLRLKQQEHRGKPFYVNFNQGVFLTQDVLDALLRQGQLKKRVLAAPRRRRGPGRSAHNPNDVLAESVAA